VNLILDGSKWVDESELRSRLPLRPGGPFHPVLLDETVSAIRAFYRARGFESIQLSSSVDWNKEETLADVTVRILEGPRSVVDRVVVRGNQRTRSKSIRDALNLRTGEYISTGRLLEAQNNLYQLGAFSSVTVKRAPGTPFKGERDILVEVEEGSRHTFTYGFGLDTEDGFTGLFGYSRSNMFGRGVSGRVDLRAGRDSLARLLLYQPFLGRRRITTTGSLFYIEETRESFESLRRGGQFEAQRVGNSSRTGVLFDYRLVDQVDLVTGGTPTDPTEPGNRDLEEIQIASLTPAWQLDHRDSPVNPLAGWSTNLQVQYAFPLFQADEEFLKSFIQYTHFFDFGWLGSLGGSFRLGGIEPLDKAEEGLPDLPDEPDTIEIQDSAYVAISERYFAGGSTTHRAYRRDALGICGETLVPFFENGAPDLPIEELCLIAPEYRAIGGNGQLLLNLDYRFPIAGPFMGNVFVDAGNVWGSWRNINLSDIKTGVGVGVRYLSPVGPIRLEAGWKLDRLPGEDPYVIFFSVGNAF
jgi:outer membrane protein insertion porin family/translocation and assembly module TamA